MKLDKELRKFEITQKDTIGRTAIHIAAIHDKVKILRKKDSKIFDQSDCAIFKI